ncbi:hypothetical protein [Mycoavidus sp. SF9855]|nr:hypothetical protein [Mycoavidus sp. SF9855]UUM21027.1 hypothetical protein NQD60_06025 [Mycoavidus sp. SF9855]
MTSVSAAVLMACAISVSAACRQNHIVALTPNIAIGGITAKQK